MSFLIRCTFPRALSKLPNFLAHFISVHACRLHVPMRAMLILSFGLSVQAYAAPGDLDATFGQGGRVIVANPTPRFTLSSAIATVVQADNKIIAVSEAVNGLSGSFFITRLNPDGSSDLSFGTRGSTTTAFPGRDIKATAVALQRDGKIVVVGSSFLGASADFAAVRYNLNGSLDSTFGNSGKVLTNFGGSDEPTALVIQRDGKIIVAGTTDQVPLGGSPGSRLNFVVVRYNLDGKVDQTFRDRRVGLIYGITPGVTYSGVIIDFSGKDDRARAVAVQQDGRIVMAGSANNPLSDTPSFALARFNPDGSEDKTFGANGRLTTKFNSPPPVDPTERTSSLAVALAIQPDGKIVAGGTARISHFIGSSAQSVFFGFVLARYTTDGKPDIQFGTNGLVLPKFGGALGSIQLQPNGKILMGGTLPNDTSPNGQGITGGGLHQDIFGSAFTLVRYTRDGYPDPGFGNGGQVITKFNPTVLFADPALRALALQPDGKIIAVGRRGDHTLVAVESGQASEFAVARYLGDPVPLCFGKFSTQVGTALHDVLTGTVDQDVISGLGGDDTIYGGGGNDLICGGPGNDLILGQGGNNLVDGEAGDDLIFGGTGNSVMMGGVGNDTLVGSSGNDIIFAGDGDDILMGGGGNDLLMGEAGNDFLYGNDGNDYIDGGVGTDLLNGGNQTDICVVGNRSEGDTALGCELVGATP